MAQTLNRLVRFDHCIGSLAYNQAVSPPVRDHLTGVETYQVCSPYSSGPQAVKVLTPLTYDPGKVYRVLYLLPVEKGFETGFGDALKVLRELDAHNGHDLILVQMGFAQSPWFGDHTDDPLVRQATYLRKIVVPLIEKRYSTLGTKEGRLLFGFSKSGWGAFSLILRNPEFYGYAAAWDAPMMFRSFHWDMKSVFGTQAQFDAFRPDLLISTSAGAFSSNLRLLLGGEKLWGTFLEAPGGRSHTVVFHELLMTLGVQHVYRDDLALDHSWNAGWAGPMLEELMRLTQSEEKEGDL